MESFESPHDPLAERVSDGELREILERLGEAELGGDDRATVGAIVEATGADVAIVLRLLGDVRQRAIDDQCAAMEALEGRLSRLERPASFRSETVAPLWGQGELNLVILFAALLALSLLLTAFLAHAMEPSKPPGSPAGHAVPGYEDRVIYDTPVPDGLLVVTPERRALVVRPDGTTREPTGDERALVAGYASERTSEPSPWLP